MTWIDRKNDGQALVEAVAASAFDAAGRFGRVACGGNRTTRAVAKVFREDYAIPRRAVNSQAYWPARIPTKGISPDAETRVRSGSAA